MHPKALLDAASQLLRRVLTFEHPADAQVSRFFRENRQLGPRERATLAETTYAVLRHKRLFEHLAQTGKGPRERRLAILGFHGDRSFLRAALDGAETAWLDDCQALLPEQRAQQPQDMPGHLPEHLPEALRHNLPDWLAERLHTQLDARGQGAQFWPLVHSLNHSAPLDLRINTLQGKRDAIARELRQAGLTLEPTPYSPWGLRVQGKPALQKLEAFRRGAIEVQDEGSQLLALLLDAHRGEMVADLCAGAGGKTLAIGAAMRSTGRLYAFDVSAHRLEALKPRLARSGLSNVHPIAIAHERDERIKRLAGKLDRVLVDAPCSGLGTLRRSPDLKWRQSPQAVRELVDKQQAILKSAARLLKPGGRLVYATCSLLDEENEGIATAFDAEHSQTFTPIPAANVLQGLKIPQAENLCSPAPETTDQTHGDGDTHTPGRFLRLWPHQHATDAFFAAVWERG